MEAHAKDRGAREPRSTHEGCAYYESKVSLTHRLPKPLKYPYTLSVIISDSYYQRKAMTKANDIQVAGDHYKTQAIQTWDFIIANKIGYMEGNVIKYISRWRDKGGVDDLKKAQHYLAKLIEVTQKGSL
jgi:hypothetical protein